MYLTDSLKKSIVAKIKEVTIVEKIILFGSYAVGKANENSDIDLLVIEKAFDSKYSEKIKLRKALSDIKIPKDILIIDSQAFEFYKHEPCSVYRDAFENGEVLWSI